MKRYFVDGINLLDSTNENSFAIRLILCDTTAKYFTTNCIKTVKVNAKYIDKKFLMQCCNNVVKDYDVDSIQIKQGVVYDIDEKKLKEKIKNNEEAGTLFSEKSKDQMKEIALPKKKEYFTVEKNREELEKKLSLKDNDNNQESKSLLLYCFNVGQGESLLFITPMNSAYIIDTNINSNSRVCNFVKKIKDILEERNITEIKSLIVTHKHVDHIRGMDSFIKEISKKDENPIPIRSFMVNCDYEHNSDAYRKVCEAVENNISVLININDSFHISEGNLDIDFINPDKETCKKDTCADINNSSIVMVLSFKKVKFYLTGDISYDFLKKKIMDNSGNIDHSNESLIFLKIAHHGSRTGTDQTLLETISPKMAFISAGENKKFNHPHSKTTKLLKDHHIETKISKKYKKDVLYSSDGNQINSSKYVYISTSEEDTYAR